MYKQNTLTYYLNDMFNIKTNVMIYAVVQPLHINSYSKRYVLESSTLHNAKTNKQIIFTYDIF